MILLKISNVVEFYHFILKNCYFLIFSVASNGTVLKVFKELSVCETERNFKLVR